MNALSSSSEDEDDRDNKVLANVRKQRSAEKTPSTTSAETKSKSKSPAPRTPKTAEKKKDEESSSAKATKKGRQSLQPAAKTGRSPRAAQHAKNTYLIACSGLVISSLEEKVLLIAYYFIIDLDRTNLIRVKIFIIILMYLKILNND